MSGEKNIKLLASLAILAEAIAKLPSDTPGIDEVKSAAETIEQDSKEAVDVVQAGLDMVNDLEKQLAESAQTISSLKQKVAEGEKSGAIKKEPSSVELGKSLQAKAQQKQKDLEKAASEAAKKDASNLDKIAQKRAEELAKQKQKEEADKQKEREKEEKDFAAKAKSEKLVAVRFLRSPSGSPFFIGSREGELWMDTEPRCQELIDAGYAKLIK